MFLKYRFTITIFLISTLFLFTGFGCRPNQERVQEEIENIELSYWQVWQNSFDIQPLIEEYEKLYPNVRINFRNLRFEEYEQELLKAFAEDRGPDILSIPHDWIGLYRELITPQPQVAEIQRVIMRPPGPGELKPSIGQVYKEQVPLITARDIKQKYYAFVAYDILEKNPDASRRTRDSELILGLPLYVDNLGLYYNKKILEDSEIYDPPETWEKFQQDVIAIAKINENNEIIQPSAALGTAQNLIRPTDILSTLMLQTGVDMIDEERGVATFHESIREKDGYNAGLEALRFYTDFSDVTKKVYTWNDSQPQALEMFRQGKLAYLFGYAYNLDDIQNSKVDYGVAPIPTPVIAEGVSRVTVANYWVETVSKKSKFQSQAWHFLNFLSKSENLKRLQDTTRHISPLKEHASTIEDEDLKVFAFAANEAVSWYRGKNAIDMEKAMTEMIDSVVSGKRGLEEALSFGAQLVTRTLR